MAFNSPLWKIEVLTCNSLNHLSSSRWGWLASPDPDTGYYVKLPVQSKNCYSQSYHTMFNHAHTHYSTLARQWQTVKLLITSHALDGQKGESAWSEATKLPRKWQKPHSRPVFPSQSCSVMPPKEAGKKWESCRAPILTTKRIPRHFVKINDKGILSDLAINWNSHQSFLWKEF